MTVDDKLIIPEGKEDLETDVKAVRDQTDATKITTQTQRVSSVKHTVLKILKRGGGRLSPQLSGTNGNEKNIRLLPNRVV